jgi:hypothetical protein
MHLASDIEVQNRWPCLNDETFVLYLACLNQFPFKQSCVKADILDTRFIPSALFRITTSPSPAEGISAEPILSGLPLPSRYAAWLVGEDIVEVNYCSAVFSILLALERLLLHGRQPTYIARTPSAPDLTVFHSRISNHDCALSR